MNVKDFYWILRTHTKLGENQIIEYTYLNFYFFKVMVKMTSWSRREEVTDMGLVPYWTDGFKKHYCDKVALRLDNVG